MSKRYPIYFQTQFSHSISSPFLGDFSPLSCYTRHLGLIFACSVSPVPTFSPSRDHGGSTFQIYSESNYGSFLLPPPWSILHRVWDVPSLPSWHSQLCAWVTVVTKIHVSFSLRIFVRSPLPCYSIAFSFWTFLHLFYSFSCWAFSYSENIWDGFHCSSSCGAFWFCGKWWWELSFMIFFPRSPCAWK